MALEYINAWVTGSKRATRMYLTITNHIQNVSSISGEDDCILRLLIVNALGLNVLKHIDILKKMNNFQKKPTLFVIHTHLA